MATAEQHQYRAAVDIGGTFTDIVVALSSGETVLQKVPTTPHDFSQAVISGLKQVLSQQGLDAGAARDIVHGTTAATNSILERKGARTGLITTKGFRDVLEIGRLRRPRLYDLFLEKPVPLVERYLRLEVTERVDKDGKVLTPLDPAEVEHVLRELAGYDIEALAVCLLHSYANPAHEENIREIARSLFPGLYITISSELLPQMMEFERTSTTVTNAYVGTLVGGYLASLQRGFKDMGLTAPLLLMQSNGAIMSDRTAMERPVHMIESGPAAGVVASSSVAKRRGDTNVITLDMGGTTAKASLVINGEVSYTDEYEVGGMMSAGSSLVSGAGYRLRVPSVDVSEVGAGGGSIVWVDAAGYPRVGPQSAGAVPGPVCYNQGGTEPTITDCNVVLGYLNPDYLLGGSLEIDSVKSAAALDEHVAKPLGLSTMDAAYGAHALAISNMTRAVRAVTSERGRDPRNSILYAFGGGGPLYAVDLARSLGIRKVVVPLYPGLFSAMGLLFTQVQVHSLQSFVSLTSNLTVEALSDVMERLRLEAMRVMSKDGFTEDKVQLRYAADARYRGQSFELVIPLPSTTATQGMIDRLPTEFSTAHERTYGYKIDYEQVEVVNVRLIATGLDDRTDAFDYKRASVVGAGTSSTSKPRQRQVFFGSDPIDVPVYDRGGISQEKQGPFIIEEYDSTTIVPPGCSAKLDEFRNIEIQVGA